jgi:hypothetical protein
MTHSPTYRPSLTCPFTRLSLRGWLWRRGHAAWVAAVQSGRYLDAPTVYASGARGEPVRDGWLRFTFRDNAAYRELVSAPALSAIVTVDRTSSAILGVRFLGGRGA